MAKTISEITPMERELSTGNKIPMSYTTLARTVYLDSGERLQDAWEKNIMENALPVISQITSPTKNHVWNVIRYGTAMADAKIHIFGVTPSSVVVSTNQLKELLETRVVVTLDSSLVDTAILTYHVELPIIQTGESTFVNMPLTTIPIVTAGDNCSFAESGEFPFSIQASIEATPNTSNGNNSVKIRVITASDILENIYNTGGNASADFHISATGLLY